MEVNFIAPYLIRLYVWELLKRNLGMTDDDYDANGDGQGLVPIVPLGEEPEVKEFGKPYLVYGYSENMEDVTCVKGNMAFIVYSDDFYKISEIVNLIAKTFEKEHAAKDVNEYTSTIPQFVGIRFGNIQMTTVEGGSPEDEEGGNMSGVVTIAYEYYSDPIIQTSFATWNGTQYISN